MIILVWYYANKISFRDHFRQNPSFVSEDTTLDKVMPVPNMGKMVHLIPHTSVKHLKNLLITHHPVTVEKSRILHNDIEWRWTWRLFAEATLPVH